MFLTCRLLRWTFGLIMTVTELKFLFEQLVTREHPPEWRLTQSNKSFCYFCKLALCNSGLQSYFSKSYDSDLLLTRWSLEIMLVLPPDTFSYVLAANCKMIRNNDFLMAWNENGSPAGAASPAHAHCIWAAEIEPREGLIFTGCTVHYKCLLGCTVCPCVSACVCFCYDFNRQAYFEYLYLRTCMLYGLHSCDSLPC